MPSSTNRRVLVIGLDGATWTNLEPLAARGDLPNLQRLIAEGARGDLLSTTPALTPPAWASLVTGTNPGKHGIYHFRHTPRGDYYQRRLNTSRDIAVPTIWQRLNQHGIKVGVMNIPLSHPVYPVDGFITNDVFAPDTSQLVTHPAALASRFPKFVMDVAHYPTALPSSDQYRTHMLRFVAENVHVLETQADAALELMRTESWQFFMVGWMITDRLGHFAWKYSDPAGATRFTSDIEREIGQAVRDAYRQLDQRLGDLIAAAGPAGTVIIASDHGFGPIPQQFFNTNRWLVDRGYLQLFPGWHPQRALLGNLPRSWKSRLRVPIDSKHGLVDWNQTTVWADPLESRAVGLHLNRRDRYPEGIVAETDCDALERKLIGELRSLQTRDGAPQFSAIHRASDLYTGPHAIDGPDLVAILAKPYDVPASFRRDVRARELVTPNRHVLRDGGHEPEGIYLLWGNGIKSRGRLSPQPIVSIAPTIMRLFGLAVDADMDGAPIDEALDETVIGAAEKTGPAVTPPFPTPGSQPEYSGEDEAAVEERLRNLGYLD